MVTIDITTAKQLIDQARFSVNVLGQDIDTIVYIVNGVDSQGNQQKVKITAKTLLSEQ